MPFHPVDARHLLIRPPWSLPATPRRTHRSRDISLEKLHSA
jgi:hypothetical protein